jgi:hypothetical protein
MKTLHLKRSAVLAGLVGVAMGAMLLVPAAAQAKVPVPPKGQFQGGLTLTPPSGGPTVVPGFSAAHACPAGTVNATVSLIDNSGNEIQDSAPIDAGTVSGPFTGTLQSNFGLIATAILGLTAADSFELTVDCHALAGVPGTFTDSAIVNLQPDGTFTTGAGAVKTTTTLTGPSIVAAGGNVTLNAAVAPANAVGKVQFMDNNVALGAAVTVSNGTAQFSTTTLAIGSHPMTAVFTPTDATAFQASTSNGITVVVSGGDVQGETINVFVPSSEGVFTMTVSSTPVSLSDAALSADNTTFESTGSLGAVTVSDGRNQSHPGWHISGQVSNFSDGTHTINGNSLGWTPQITTPNAANDVVAGAAVASGSNPGLAQGSPLASAAAAKGLGTTVLGALLDLKVPSSTASGHYTGTLTITAVESAS